MLTPTVRRTFAPRGQTPVLNSWDRRDRISVISAITVSPKRKQLNFYFLLLPDDTNAHATDTVVFLKHLRRHLPGPFTVVWDRSNIHDRSLLVRAFLADHPEIKTEKFPSYAPELNPDEQAWSHSKYGRMANFAPDDTKVLRRKLKYEFKRLKLKQELLAGFIRHSGLSVRV